jgi:hypothetical protein
VGVNRLVALAAAVVEALNIEDMNATAAIIDETSFLKFSFTSCFSTAVSAVTPMLST